MTNVRARWFPASIRLPADMPQVRGRLYVLLCEGGERAGLHVFARPGEDADVHLPVNWSATVIPKGRGARNGVDVHLDDGRLAVITAGAGCRCGQLGRWPGPTWATNVTVRA